MRILIINSCGKAKVGSFEGQPTCKDLHTDSQRQQVKRQYFSKALPARDLYIGPQAKAVSLAVDLLREYHQVDYYIISAGFGLVEENTPLPPYECTFSGKGKSKVRSMAEKLGIPADITSLPSNYDLIYLALGKDYLVSMGDVSLLDGKGKQVVNFSRDEFEGQHFVYLDDRDIVGVDISVKHGIGNYVMSKGTILLNLAQDVADGDLDLESTSVSGWWNNLVGGVPVAPKVVTRRYAHGSQVDVFFLQEHQPRSLDLGEYSPSQLQHLGAVIAACRPKLFSEEFGDWRDEVLEATGGKEILKKASTLLRNMISKGSDADAMDSLLDVLRDHGHPQLSRANIRALQLISQKI